VVVVGHEIVRGRAVFRDLPSAPRDHRVRAVPFIFEDGRDALLLRRK
jgi:hypothetical protein